MKLLKPIKNTGQIKFYTGINIFQKQRQNKEFFQEKKTDNASIMSLL